MKPDRHRLHAAIPIAVAILSCIPRAEAQIVTEFVDYTGIFAICNERVGQYTSPLDTFQWSQSAVTTSAEPPLTCSSGGFGPFSPTSDYLLSCERAPGRTYCMRPYVSQMQRPDGSRDSYVFDVHSMVPGSSPDWVENFEESPILIEADVRFFCLDDASPGGPCGPDHAERSTVIVAGATAAQEEPTCGRPPNASVGQASTGNAPVDATGEPFARVSFYVRRPLDGDVAITFNAAGRCPSGTKSGSTTINVDLSDAMPCMPHDLGVIDVCEPPPPEINSVDVSWNPHYEFACDCGFTDLEPGNVAIMSENVFAFNPPNASSGRVCSPGPPGSPPYQCRLNLMPPSPDERGIGFQTQIGTPTNSTFLTWVRHYAILDKDIGERAGEPPGEPDVNDLGDVYNIPAFTFPTIRFAAESSPESTSRFFSGTIRHAGADLTMPLTRPLLPFSDPTLEDQLGTFRQGSATSFAASDIGREFRHILNDGAHQIGTVTMGFGSSFLTAVDRRIPTVFAKKECRSFDLPYCLGRLTIEIEDELGEPISSPTGRSHSVGTDPYDIDGSGNGSGPAAPIVYVSFDLPEESYTFDQFMVRKGLSTVALGDNVGPVEVGCGSRCCTGLNKPILCPDPPPPCVEDGKVRLTGTADHPAKGIDEVHLQYRDPLSGDFVTCRTLRFPCDGLLLTGRNETEVRYDGECMLPAPGAWEMRVTATALDGSRVSCPGTEELFTVFWDDDGANISCWIGNDETQQRLVVKSCATRETVRARGEFCGANFDFGAISSIATHTPHNPPGGGPSLLGQGSDVYGAEFPIGSTEIVFTGSGALQGAAACAVQIEVLDTEAPSVLCPSNIVAEADVADSNFDGLCEALVTYQACASDNCTPAILPVLSPGSASVFQLGPNPPVTAVASDASGNDGSCSFYVTVVDTRPPVFVTSPPPLTELLLSLEPDDDGDGQPGDTNCKIDWQHLVTAQDLCGATIADPDAPFVFTPLVGPADGELKAGGLAPGIHASGLVAFDGSANVARAGFAVNVIDDVPPKRDCGSSTASPNALIEFVGNPPTHIRVNNYSVTDNCEEVCCQATINGVVVEAGGLYRVRVSRNAGVIYDSMNRPAVFLGTTFTASLQCDCGEVCGNVLELPGGDANCAISFFRHEEPGPKAQGIVTLYNDSGATAAAVVDVYDHNGNRIVQLPSLVPNNGNVRLAFDDVPVLRSLPSGVVVLGWVHVTADRSIEALLEIDTNRNSDVPSGTTIECSSVTGTEFADQYFKVIRVASDSNDNAVRRPVVAIVNRGSVPAEFEVKAFSTTGAPLGVGSWRTAGIAPNAMVFFNTAVTGMGTVEGNLHITSTQEVSIVQVTHGPKASLSNQPPEPFIIPRDGQIFFNEQAIERLP